MSTPTTTLPIAGAGLTVVTGLVPDDKVGAALAALDALARPHDGWTPMTRREATARYPEGQAWKAPKWEAGDDDRFRWVVEHASDRTLAGFRALAEAERLTGEEIAARTEYPDAHAWRAALPHIRAYCARVDRQPIWFADHKEEGRSIYEMSEVVRALALAHIPAR